MNEGEHFCYLLLVAGGDEVLQLRRNFNRVVPGAGVLVDHFVRQENVMLGRVTGSGASLFVGFPKLLRLGAFFTHTSIEPNVMLLYQIVVQCDDSVLQFHQGICRIRLLKGSQHHKGTVGHIVVVHGMIDGQVLGDILTDQLVGYVMIHG